QGRERFRRHDEKRLCRVKIAGCLYQIYAIDVGHEPESHRALAVIPKRFVGHYRAQIGTPNADVDDVSNPLPGVSLPITVSDPIREVRHSVQHSVDLWHHVLAIKINRSLRRRTQS